MNDMQQATYLNRDFDTLVNGFLGRLRQQFSDDYNDFVVSSLGSVLIDLVMYGSEQIAWTQDRRIADASLALTKSLDQATIRARELGYTPAGAVSASKDVQLSLAQTYAFVVTVPAGFRLKGPGGLVFETVDEVEFLAGQVGPATVTVTEGRRVSFAIFSSGEANQTFTIPQASSGKFVASESMKVIVDGFEWTEIPRLDFEAGQVFEVEYTRAPPRLRFGDGITGDIPATGAEIRVSFILTSGQSGNVGEGAITEPVEPLVANFTTIALQVSDTMRASGGMNAESLSSIKANAPGYFGSRGVAVTRNDYIALAKNFRDPLYGRVASASAFVARSVVGDAQANAYLVALEAEIEAYQTQVGTLAQTLASVTGFLQSSRNAIAAQATLMQGQLVDLANQLAIIQSSNTTLRSQGAFCSSGSSALNAMLNGTGYTYSLAQIVTFTSGAPGGTAYGNDLGTMRSVLIGLEADLSSAASTISAQAGLLRSAAGASQGLRQDLETARAVIASTATTMQTQLNSLLVLSNLLEEVVSNHQQAVSGIVSDLRDHLDEVFAADCKSNVISVPILGFDANGFYVPPSRGLIRALQTYLRERCDVAHVVFVVDGSYAFVRVGVQIRLRVNPRSIYQVVASLVLQTVNNIMRAREFGAGLFLHTVHVACKDLPGVDVINVSFSSDEFLVEGNVIVPPDRVIVPDTIQISPL